MPNSRSETSIATEAINRAAGILGDAADDLAAEDWEGIKSAHSRLRSAEELVERAVVALERLANRLERRIGAPK
jgi:hypothetical protein